MSAAELSALRGASPEEVARYFSRTDAVELVEAVGAASDAQLTELLGRDDVRSIAIDAVLVRLPEHAVPERLAAMHGVVQFDLQHHGRFLERHAIEFTRGDMQVHKHVRDDEDYDVALSTTVLNFVRVMTGQVNAGLEYLSGRLDIRGDADLALALGGVFRVPGTDQVAVDPTALDPADVATALKGVKSDHLKAVMSSGFRRIVLGEVFRRLPDFVDRDAAADARLTIGFRMLGAPDGEVERYVVRIDHGTATVETGDEGEQRDATITMQAHDFLRLATGHLNPVTGVLKGQLKVKGDKAKALALTSLLDIPKPR